MRELAYEEQHELTCDTNTGLHPFPSNPDKVLELCEYVRFLQAPLGIAVLETGRNRDRM